MRYCESTIAEGAYMNEVTPLNFNLPEYVFNRIYHDILTGKYRAGDKLVEAVFQDEFQVSKSPIREAFQMLINAGLVERINRRGCFVKNFTTKEIEDIYQVRMELEGVAAKYAYEHMTDSDLAQLNALYSHMEQAVDRDDADAYFSAHNEFQRFFDTMSDNKVLMEVCEKLRVQNQWYTHQFHIVDIHFDIHTHDDLIEHFNKKDVTSDEIRELMREHIEIGLNNFHAFLNAQ